MWMWLKKLFGFVESREARIRRFSYGELNFADGFNYASPPANFGSVDFTGTAARDAATYVAVE